MENVTSPSNRTPGEPESPETTPRARQPMAWLRSWWVAAAIGAAIFLIWAAATRVRHIDYVTAAAGTAPTLSANSPTGYAGGVRRLIVGGNDNEGSQWIMQTQGMLARHTWHLHHVDYDNAPEGREVSTGSPYRWWLGFVAWTAHAATGQPVGREVEFAAEWADAILRLLLLAVVAVYAARRFGTLAAAGLSLALVGVFPLAATFLPGHPQDGGLTLAVALGSILPLLAALGDTTADRTQVRRDFLVAGMIGGLGLWVDVGSEATVLAGIALGGLAATLLRRRAENGAEEPEILPWRRWALGGAAMTLLAYALDGFYTPAAGLRLSLIHPLDGLAWLGAGELLARLEARRQGLRTTRKWRSLAVLVLAIIAILIPVWLAVRQWHDLFAPTPSADRLTRLFEGAVAGNFGTWVQHEGFGLVTLAILLPLALIVPAIWLAVKTPVAATRRALLIALGPLVVALPLAYFRLSWWGLVDATLLAVLALAASVSTRQSSRRWAFWTWFGAITAGVVPGLMLLAPSLASIDTVTPSEVEALVERDLAQWLVNRAGPGRAVVLASPEISAALSYYGGIRAVGSPYPENRDGFAATLRIFGTSSQDEAQALVQRRGVTHLVLLSWDTSLETFVRTQMTKSDEALLTMLHKWRPPRWLRPIPYAMPQIAGFEGQSATIFEVVDLQENAVALSHLAEYFVETNQLDLAAEAADALARLFPNDLGATVARAEADIACGYGDAARQALAAVENQVAAGAGQSMPWDRRVALAIVLTQAKAYGPARAQVERCLADIDEPSLRSLTTVSLYRFEKMVTGFGLEIKDPKLRELAESLLPPEMRADLH